MYIKDKCYCSKCLKEIEPGMICPFCGFDADVYESPKYALPVDSIIRGKYQIGCVIGSGGFGITYAGWDLSLNKPVAVKEFFPRTTVSRNADDTFFVTPNGNEDNHLIYYKGVNWFQREARILAALNDTPNIVHVEDYFKENGTAYIIMDYIQGKPLSVYAKENGGKLDAKDVFRLMKKPIESLQKVHRYGLIHRDISPDNLILSEDGEVYIIDFGAATSLDENSELKATELFMNKSFAPPEQESEKDQGTWTDIYSVCATMLFLITGENIPSSVVREQNDSVPGLLKCLNINRRQRNALLHGLCLKVCQRTENTAFLINELYNIPLPKSDVEKKRQKQLIKYIIICFAASYVLLYAGLALKIEQQIPSIFIAWFKHDINQAILTADRYALGYYWGGSALAKYWYHWAADNGNDEQKFEVAKKYQENAGDYLEQDNDYALQLLIEAGENGYTDAFSRLGYMYWTGEYVTTPDLDKTIYYLKKAVELKNAPAMTLLAMLYINTYDDFNSALSLLTTASEMGNYDAKYYLSLLYDNGDGVSKDDTKSMELLLEAAEAGQADAMGKLGYYYLTNDITLNTGTTWRDVGTGLYWLNKAVSAGSAAAKYNLAQIYMGELDVSGSIKAEELYKEDPEKAFSYMLEAAESGHFLAILEMPIMYMEGYGTEVNLDCAQEWLKKVQEVLE